MLIYYLRTICSALSEKRVSLKVIISSIWHWGYHSTKHLPHVAVKTTFDEQSSVKYDASVADITDL